MATRKKNFLIFLVVLLISLFFFTFFLFRSAIAPKEDTLFTNNNGSGLKDICVDWVRPIDIGYARPFWPFSPDSQWIAYNNIPPETKITRNEPEGIYLIKYDGTEKKFLVEGGYRPAFGRYQWKVVYSKEGKSGAPGPKGQGREHDIFMINFDGSNEVQLTNTKKAEVMKIWGTTPITYEGKRIIYMTYDQGIWMVNIDGTNAHQIIDYSGHAAAYTPDGKNLFTTQGDILKKGYISVGYINLDNPKKQKWLTTLDFSKNDYSHLDVNLDGTLATFDNPQWENRNIWIAKLDGSNEHVQLTDYQGKFGEQGVTWGNHPRLSPDGNWIVYDEQTLSEDGKDIKNKVMVINVHTKKKKEIYDGLVPKHSGWMEPGWSPDGKKIIFYAPDPKNDNKASVWVAFLKECSQSERVF